MGHFQLYTPTFVDLSASLPFSVSPPISLCFRLEFRCSNTLLPFLFSFSRETYTIILPISFILSCFYSPPLSLSLYFLLPPLSLSWGYIPHISRQPLTSIQGRFIFYYPDDKVLYELRVGGNKMPIVE